MERYILNESPVKTVNNFGINNIEAILNIPEYKEFENFNLYTENIENINIDITEESIVSTNKIGIERNSNYSIKITVPENTKVKDIIKLEFDLDEENEFLVENIDIILEKNSSADFEIIYGNEDISPSPKKHLYHNGQLNVKLKENSKAKITIFNIIDKDSDNIYAMENEINDDAELEYIIAEIGGKNKISNYYSKLIGENAKNYLNMIYLGKEKDTIDINYIMELYEKNTECNMNIQGAIDNYSKKNFKGTIDFKKGSKKAVGKEKENCMILSSNAKSKSLPMLLCKEEDVEGEHGVSSGKIDEAKLFYIMSKGISYEDAKRLIIKANFNDILQKVTNEDLISKLETEIEKI